MDGITIDRKTLKALGADTRIAILKALAKRKMTQAELATLLGLSAPSIKEHLASLAQADLVEVKDEGRKWKYYSITQKATAITEPNTKPVWMILTLSAVALIYSATNLYSYLTKYLTSQTSLAASSPIPSFAAAEANDFSIAAVSANAKTVSPQLLTTQIFPTTETIIFIISLLLLGVCIGFLAKANAER